MDGEGGVDAVDAPEAGDVEEDAPGDDALGEEGYGLGFCAVFAVDEGGGMAVVHLAAGEDVAKGVDVGDAVAVVGQAHEVAGPSGVLSGFPVAVM